MGSFRERAVLARKIINRPWIKRTLAIWAAIAFYDTLVSQFFPESWAKKAPKMRELISETSGWLPWWAWLLILAAIIAIASFEYAVRKTSARDEKARDNDSKVIGDWISPLEAVSRFAPPEVCRDFKIWKQRTSEIGAQIRQLYTDSQDLKSGSSESIALSERLRALDKEHQAAKEKLLQANGPAFEYLLSQLKSGGLMARGFTVPRRSGDKPTGIDPSEWVGMHLDVENAVAFCDERYGGTQYAGVTIGKPTSGRIFTRPDVTANPLKIIISTGGWYEDKRASGIYMTTHTFIIGVKNTDPENFLSNCNLYLNIADQKSPAQKSYRLVEPFTLNASEEKNVPIVSYDEPASISEHAGSHICLLIPVHAGYYDVGSGWPWQIPIGAYTFTLRATSKETGPYEVACKTWVDDAKKLHFEQA